MGSGSSKSSTNSKNEENVSKNTDFTPVKTLNNNTTRQHDSLASDQTVTKENPVSKDTGLKPSSKEEDSTNKTSNEVDVEEVLISKGFDDPILSSFCKETPKLLDTFIKLYEHVQLIREKIESENIIPVLTPHLKGIKSAYFDGGKNQSRKIQKGEFLAKIGFADVYKDIVDRVLPRYPSLLNLVKFGSDDNETENPVKKEENQDQTASNNPNVPSDDGASNTTKTNEQVASPEEELAKENLKKARTFLDILLRISMNYTDKCDQMRVAFSKAGLVPIWIDMVDQLKDCTEFHLKWMDYNGHLPKKTVRGTLLSLSLGTLHNLARNIKTRTKFHECNGVSILVPMLEDPVVFFAAKALFVLAYLIDESNDHLIKSKDEPLKLIISFLDKAIYSKNKRCCGFSSCEIADGLTQIAINDNNKKLIVANGVLPVMMAMIKLAHEDEERANAVNVLWILAFNEDNRTVMKETEGLMEVLYSLKGNTDPAIKKALSGALWELEGKQNHSVETTKGDHDQSTTQQHVMISYQWDVQETLIQVKNKLQAAGFNVWMDLEQMGGSTLEAMAGAVENSAVVLVCVSQKYKENSNCRSEAEYAFQLKKDIVPLMMDKKYQPNGWLGMIMGSKLWIDFSGAKKIEASVKELIRELGSRGSGEQHVTHAVTADTVDAVPVVQVSPKVNITGWTNQDVMSWMEPFGLETKEVHKLHKLTGTMLMLLHTLRNESPDFYYTSLKDDIGLLDVCSVLTFTHELEKLVG